MKGTKSDRETLRARVKEALGDGTQKELEQALELSGGTLSRVFGGRRNVDAAFLRKLADALGIEVTRLLHGTDFLLLFDEEELPREAGDVDVVAPLPPPPAPGPSPVSGLPSRGGAATTEASAPEPSDDSARGSARRSSTPEAEVESAADPGGTDGVKLSELDTEPTMPVVDLPDLANGPAEPARKKGDTTVSVDEPVPAPPPRRGITGRIRRFLSSLFGG